MNKEQKNTTIEALKEKFADSPFFYVADASSLSVEKVTKLRRLFFEQGIEMKVLKNTLVRKALEAAPEEKNYAALYDALHGPTAVLFTDTANLPARLIKEFRGDNAKPAVKAAYIDSAVYIGDEQLDALSKSAACSVCLRLRVPTLWAHSTPGVTVSWACSRHWKKKAVSNYVTLTI